MKRVLTFLLFFLLIVILLFFLFIPDWLSSTSLEYMKNWYPNIGGFFYFFNHTLSYVLLGTGLLVLIVINYKNIVTCIKSNKSESFYTVIFLLLVVQFRYCMVYTEFYPAVMMPSFSYGKIDLNNFSINNSELKILTEQGRVFSLDMEVVLDELPISMRSSVANHCQSNKKLFNQVEFIDWLTRKLVSKIPPNDTIVQVEMYKIVRKYSFQKREIIEKEKNEFLIQIIKR